MENGAGDLRPRYELQPLRGDGHPGGFAPSRAWSMSKWTSKAKRLRSSLTSLRPAWKRSSRRSRRAATTWSEPALTHSSVHARARCSDGLAVRRKKPARLKKASRFYFPLFPRSSRRYVPSTAPGAMPASQAVTARRRGTNTSRRPF